MGLIVPGRRIVMKRGVPRDHMFTARPFQPMPSSEVIDSYISRVVSAETHAEEPVREVVDETSEAEAREVRLQQELQEALDKDDKRKAIKAAWALMQDDVENDDIRDAAQFPSFARWGR